MACQARGQKDGDVNPAAAAAVESAKKQQQDVDQEQPSAEQEEQEDQPEPAPEAAKVERLNLKNQAALHLALDGQTGGYFLDALGLQEDVRLSNLKLMLGFGSVVLAAVTYFLVKDRLLAGACVVSFFLVQALLQLIYMRLERDLVYVSRPLGELLEHWENASFGPEAESLKAEEKLQQYRRLIPKPGAGAAAAGDGKRQQAGGRLRSRKPAQLEENKANVQEKPAAAAAAPQSLVQEVVAVSTSWPRHSEHYTVSLVLRHPKSVLSGLLGGPQELTRVSRTVPVAQLFDSTGVLLTETLDTELAELWSQFCSRAARD